MKKSQCSTLQGVQCHYGPTNLYTITSPIGDIHVMSCPKGLHSVGQANEISDDNFEPNEKITVWLKDKYWDDNGYMYKPATYCTEWLKAFFENPSKTQNMALPSLCPGVASPSGTFRQRVWLTLAERVPAGQTVSYGELARLVGNPGAAQAVGTAMKTNPFQLIVPCHRVIRGSGQMGLYGCGKRNKVKEWLLAHEKKQITAKR